MTKFSESKDESPKVDEESAANESFDIGFKSWNLHYKIMQDHILYRLYKIIQLKRFYNRQS